MKMLFFTGKGGVGKSTSSALTALHLADSGLSVLLNSIDPAHNLGDIFHAKLGEKEKTLTPRLSVMETDLQLWIKRYLKRSEEDFRKVYKYQDAFNLQSYFSTIRYSPGIEEYAVLLAIQDCIERYSDRDYIIFDTPPTALTLRFLALPRVSLLWMKELRSLRNGILEKKGIISKIRQGRKRLENETDPVMARLEEISLRYEGFEGLLRDHQRSKVVVVLNPDQLSYAESCTIVDELEKLGISVPCMLVNKYAEEQSFLDELALCYDQVELLTMPKQSRELTGIDELRKFQLPEALARL